MKRTCENCGQEWDDGIQACCLDCCELCNRLDEDDDTARDHAWGDDEL